MKTLAIYDNTGYIHSVTYGAEEAPKKIYSLLLEGDEPLDHIDMTDPKNPQPVYIVQPETEAQRIQKQAYNFLAANIQAIALPDEQALEIPDLYPTWESGQSYTADQIVRYGTNPDGRPQLYRIVQAHTSQSDWLPDATASLYKAIGITADGVDIWVQPLGGHDAYQTGAIVKHDGKRYISTCDGNVWEPGVAGWDELS